MVKIKLWQRSLRPLYYHGKDLGQPGEKVELVASEHEMVGIITGLYPAKRACHISALNTLRYEQMFVNRKKDFQKGVRNLG